jgi:hypothetical protein
MNPAVTPIHVPFTAGMREDVDSKLLPQGVFARLQNARYRKDGRLGLRNGYAALSMTTSDGEDLVPYDVTTFRDRLVVLGNELGEGFPTNLYEYTEIEGIGWRTPTNDPSVHTVNPFTDMRSMLVPPQAAQGLQGAVAIAACHGYVMLAYRPVGNDTVLYVYVIRESDGQIVLNEAHNNYIADATALTVSNGAGGRCFILVGRNALNRVGALRFDPNSDTSLVNLGDLSLGVNAPTPLTAAEVQGADEFVVACDRGSSDLEVLRFNVAGAQQGSTITVSSTTPERLAVEASAAGDGTINLLHLDSTTLTLYTWTFAGSLTGPATLSSTCATGANNVPRIARVPANADLSWDEAVVCVWAEAPADGLSALDTYIDVRAVSDQSQLIDFIVEDFAPTTPIVVLSTSAQAFVAAFGGTVRETASLSDRCSNALAYVAGSSVAGSHYCVVDELLAVNAPGGLARDASTGRLLWAKQVVNIDNTGILTVASVAAQSSKRRQIVEQSGALFLASAQPQTWCGDVLGEIGFQELPGIRDTTTANSVGTGPIASNAEYDYVLTWTWINSRQELVRSAPSLPVTVTTGASDDLIDLDVSLPHQLRVNGAFVGALTTRLTATVWRTVWDGSAKVTGFRKAASIAAPATGGTINIDDEMTDADLASQELLYTDAGSGALSGPISRLSPRPASYLAPSAEALVTAGHPEASQFQQSLPVTPGEAVSFVPFGGVGVAFYGTCQRPVTGLALVDDLRVFFHRDGISIAAGRGPTADGQGEQPLPQLVPTNFGLRDEGWRSLLLTAEGLWFQADDEKLCLLPRGASSPEWAGQAVRTTLAAFPDIVGASLAANDNVAAWAANSDTEGRLIVRDQRTGDWIVDVLPDEDVLRGLTQHQGKVVYITTDGVRRQADDFDDGTSELIPLLAEMGDATAFGVNGWGKIVCCTLLAEYRGNCKIRGSISYDSGATYSTIKEFELEDLTVGSTQELQFWPRRRKCSRFRFRFEVLDLDGPSEGAVLHGVTFHARGTRAATKKARASRG